MQLHLSTKTNMKHKKQMHRGQIVSNKIFGLTVTAVHIRTNLESNTI